MDADLLAIVLKDITEPLFLVEVGFSVSLRLATRQVDWNGHTWLADRTLDVDASAANNGASSGKVVIGNHDNLMGAYALNQRPAGLSIRAWEAWLDRGVVRVEQVLVGVVGQALLGADVLDITVTDANALAYAPRLMYRDLIAWPPPKPDGYTFTIGSNTYTLERR